MHEFELRDSDHVAASNSYQVRIPVAVVNQVDTSVVPGDVVRVTLPITVRPKQLLFNVTVRGPDGGKAHLLLREEAAVIQAQYVAHVDGMLANEGTLEQEMWTAISAFTPGKWLHFLAETPRRRVRWRHKARSDRRSRALAAYLSAALSFDVPQTDVVRWLQQLEKPRQLLLLALGEPPSDMSAAECLLLAVPFMDLQPGAVEDVDQLVKAFVVSVNRMSEATREVLAEYGRRWEVLAELEVPVGQLCSIKITDQRPWAGAPSSMMRQQIAFGDSVTTHVEIRAADNGVVLDRVSVRKLDGELIDELADSVRDSADAQAIYWSSPDRPYFAEVSVRARLRPSHKRLMVFLFALMIGAGVVATQVPEEKDLVDSLALLLFPLTLAGALVLAREPTSLAERLLRRWRLALLSAIALLWGIALARLMLYGEVEWFRSIFEGIQDAFKWLFDLVT